MTNTDAHPHNTSVLRHSMPFMGVFRHSSLIYLDKARDLLWIFFYGNNFLVYLHISWLKLKSVCFSPNCLFIVLITLRSHEDWRRTLHISSLIVTLRLCVFVILYTYIYILYTNISQPRAHIARACQPYSPTSSGLYLTTAQCTQAFCRTDHRPVTLPVGLCWVFAKHEDNFC